MENNITEYQGKKLWNLTVIGLDPEYIGKTYNSNKWLFQCDCGNIFSASPSRVLSGHKKSCGCRKKNRTRIHGVNSDPFYHTWWAMMQRCYNPEHHNYERYGERGIYVCDEWHDPVAFVTWAKNTVGEKVPGLTLDRVDNNKGYSPENCRWATHKQQARNKRSNRIIMLDGEEKPLVEWCENYGIDVSVVRTRIAIGWDVEDAIKTPKGKVGIHIRKN